MGTLRSDYVKALIRWLGWPLYSVGERYCTKGLLLPVNTYGRYLSFYSQRTSQALREVLLPAVPFLSVLEVVHAA